MIVPVTKDNILQAGAVYAAAWRESHRAVCTPEFVELHTAERQRDLLQRKMDAGANVFLLIVDEQPAAVVSVQEDVIGDLYVLPEEQGKGYGTRLLAYAAERCCGTPALWVLNTNDGARRLYEQLGFRLTGKRKILSDTLQEWEMKRR